MALAYQHVPNTMETILDTRAVTPDQVLDLRRTVWTDGTLCRREAELLFEIDETLETVCGEWRDLFAEAMVAHLIGQARPRGHVSDADAAWFRERVERDGRIRGETELETLVQVIEKAVTVPESLTTLAIDAVCAAVLEGDRAALGNAALVAGELGDPEVALLRRVIYAGSGGRSAGISHGEAERLFDLNDATVGADNAESWSVLFVNAIANYLLTHTGYAPPSRERMKQIDRWLNSPTDGLAGFGRRLARGVTRFGDNIQALNVFGTETPLQAVYRERDAEARATRGRAGRVDAGEATWLVARIDRDGALTRNEAALLHFLRESGLPLDTSLDPLLARL